MTGEQNTSPKQKYLAFFNKGQVRIESWTYQLWHYRCSLLDNSKPFPEWVLWRESNLKSAKRGAKAAAEKRTSSAVELEWRDLSDMEDEPWDRDMHEKGFAGWPNQWEG